MNLIFSGLIRAFETAQLRAEMAEGQLNEFSELLAQYFVDEDAGTKAGADGRGEGGVRIKLTAHQIEKLRPYFDRVKSAAAMGSPGMLVGHLGYSPQSGYGINVGWLDHEKAKLIVEAARWEIPGPEGDRKTVAQNRAGRPPDIATDREET